ncbi:MAG: hypothetical protein AAF975_08315 [Spirochaetota bacterium]
MDGDFSGGEEKRSEELGGEKMKPSKDIRGLMDVLENAGYEVVRIGLESSISSPIREYRLLVIAQS